MITATSPDPDLAFPIYINQFPVEELESESPVITPAPAMYQFQDQIDLFTGIILDHNGNPVPDGTPVTFIVTSQGESTMLPQVTTSAGYAQTSYLIETTEDLTIHAISSLARSLTYTIRVISDPEEIPTQEIPPSPTFEDLVPSPSSTQESTLLDENETTYVGENSTWQDWAFSAIIILVIAITAYQIGSNSGLVLWGIRWFLSSVISGLAVYNYILLNLPGVRTLFPDGVTRSGLFVAVGVFSLFGWLVAYLYHILLESQ